ncbi:hypothetical protein [Jiangella asiatica]|uniref:Uncharacterized protein n=1 Tax=Jiangella asiatica TaxID=2530372 RepID=A0A4V2Z3L2_9ACTN|nr:hypothetical protein [Jiangella asiatica]TDE13058.1 hypothetical protein E1269_06605 [Jiangella asiatica]
MTKPPSSPSASDEDRAAARERHPSGLRHLPPDALLLKLADRYSNVQRLHTHPRLAKQRSYFLETSEYIVSLSVADPRLAALFADWERIYQHAAENGAQVATDDA